MEHKDAAVKIEKVAEFHSPIYSPVEDYGNVLHVVSTDGFAYQINGTEMSSLYNTSGQPTGLIFEEDNGSYIADKAHQAVLSQGLSEEKAEKFEVIKDFESVPLLGPNSLCLTKDSNTLFFTDSGVFGHTNISNCKGSIFSVDLETRTIKPLVYQLLAYPYGIVLSPTESAIYVSEMCRNRILRLVQNSAGHFICSTFYQFSGRFGPTAIAMHHKGSLFIARYEFPEYSKDGLITVIRDRGEVEAEIVVPDCPEITGLSFSRKDPDELYVTENTHHTLLKITVNLNYTVIIYTILFVL